jgi:uncharacterized protein (DUF433 family)
MEGTNTHWRERITSDADALFGRQHIKCTRIDVDLILALPAAGWSEAQIPDS